MASCTHCGSELLGPHHSCIPAMARRLKLLEKAVELLADNDLRDEYSKDRRHILELEEVACGNWNKFSEMLENGS